MGNRTQETLSNSDGTVKTFLRQYDTLNRLVRQSTALGADTQYSYDREGHVLERTNTLGHTVSYAYDAAYRISQLTDPSGNSTYFQYNEQNFITQVTDPKGWVTKYDYNALGDLLQVESPDQGVTEYSYDLSGNLKTRVDARGAKLEYTYDALDRPKKLTANKVDGVKPREVVSWKYDENQNGTGRLTTMSDESGDTSFEYDSHGRLIKATQASKYGKATLTQSVKYRYDSNGRPDHLTYPSGTVVSYDYDNQGRIHQLNINDKPVLENIVYQPFGPPVAWLSNGRQYTRTFDADGDISEYSLGNNDRTIEYDQGKRITAYLHNDSRLDRSFDYDDNDRIISDTANSGEIFNYEYDANGNRLSHSINNSNTLYTINNKNNRLVNSTGAIKKAYAYDKAGNILSDGNILYYWDAFGHLVETKNSTTHYEYFYNGFGQRIMKNNAELSNAPYRFIYDKAGHLLGEYDKFGRVRQETVWLGDIPVAVIDNAKIYTIDTDHLNTPRVILDSSNKPVWRWDNSDAFGSILPNNDPDKDGKKFEYNLRFPGQYFDQETGLFYNYFRYYDPKLGRYRQSDLIGLKGGVNTYTYVSNNPLRYIDPLGLEGIWIEYSSPGEPGPHQSIGVGDPNGNNLTYSFGLESGSPFGGQGQVYVDRNSGGAIRNYYDVPDSSLSAVKKELRQMYGQSGKYNLVTNNCRHFSNRVQNYLVDKYNLQPADAPERNATPQGNFGISITGPAANTGAYISSPGPTGD